MGNPREAVTEDGTYLEHEIVAGVSDGGVRLGGEGFLDRREIHREVEAEGRFLPASAFAQAKRNS